MAHGQYATSCQAPSRMRKADCRSHFWERPNATAFGKGFWQMWPRARLAVLCSLCQGCVCQCLDWLLEGRELFLSVCMGTYLRPLGSLLFEAAASELVMRHCRSSCMHVHPTVHPLDSNISPCKGQPVVPCMGQPSSVDPQRHGMHRERQGMLRGEDRRQTCAELPDCRRRNRVPGGAASAPASCPVSSLPAPPLAFFA